MSRRLEGVAWAALAVLVAGVLYATAIAVGALDIGSVPGADAPGAGFVFVPCLLALLAAAVVAFARAFRSGSDRALAWVVLAPAGAAYLVARWYGFDPYYAPTLRRYSDGGVSGSWIAAVALGSVVAGILAWLVVRAGAVAVALVVLLTALTVLLLGFGK